MFHSKFVWLLFVHLFFISFLIWPIIFLFLLLIFLYWWTTSQMKQMQSLCQPSVGGWSLFRIILKKFLEGSNWVAKDNHFCFFFLIKKHGHTSFQILVVFLNKKFNSEEINLVHVTGCPLFCSFFFHFFLSYLFA